MKEGGERLTGQVEVTKGNAGTYRQSYMRWMLFSCVVHTYSHAQIYLAATLFFVLLNCGCEAGGCIALRIANDQCLNSS